MNSQVLSPLEEEESPNKLNSAILPGDASSTRGGRLKKSLARSGAMSEADWS